LRQCRAALSWSQAEIQDLRRQLRHERQQSQRVRQSPAVVEGLAHDFSNLLETVSAAATVLRSAPPHPKPYRDALDAALAQAGVLLGTLQKWIEWEGDGASEPPDAQAVELAPTAQDALDAALLALRAPNIQVRLHLQGLPPVSASQPLMLRILSNLIWNAVEAMPGGGRLSLLGYLQQNRAVLEVSDTGVGISKQEQEKIFKAHYSTKQGHAGMGLLLVHSLVKRAGGDITFVSHPGRGSTFALSFPVANQYPAVAAPERAADRKLSVR
jgi:signal transduction histidine kinase